MKTTKKTGWPLILAIVAAAVVLALFLWPRILSAGAAHTDWTRQEAQRFIADYQAESGKALDLRRAGWPGRLRASDRFGQRKTICGIC